ncbi:MAG: hypothetical protein NTU95_03295 [Methanothrix sp.]|nr:hypothetical protein [Methanothrix sp.]
MADVVSRSPGLAVRETTLKDGDFPLRPSQSRKLKNYLNFVTSLEAIARSANTLGIARSLANDFALFQPCLGIEGVQVFRREGSPGRGAGESPLAGRPERR